MGRHREEFCHGNFGVRHRLTDETRRWKFYQRKNGEWTKQSNGCALCVKIASAVRDGATLLPAIILEDGDIPF